MRRKVRKQRVIRACLQSSRTVRATCAYMARNAWQKGCDSSLAAIHAAYTAQSTLQESVATAAANVRGKQKLSLFETVVRLLPDHMGHDMTVGRRYRRPGTGAALRRSKAPEYDDRSQSAASSFNGYWSLGRIEKHVAAT